MDLPRYFCWTKFGPESGYSIDQILAEKERHRLSCSGVFLWGIGNSVGRSISELVRACDRPEVLFSPMKSRPRRKDIAPDAVVSWKVATGLDGSPFHLFKQTPVLSGYDPKSPKKTHYALVCSSDKPLRLQPSGQAIEFKSLRNINRGTSVGSSQVTAVVEYLGPSGEDSRRYDVCLRVDLVEPYFVTLKQPVIKYQ